MFSFDGDHTQSLTSLIIFPLLTTEIKHENADGEHDPHLPDVGTHGEGSVDHNHDRNKQQPGHYFLPQCFVDIHLYKVRKIN